jgi:tetratricopeptide (TPR) repeat protein
MGQKSRLKKQRLPPPQLRDRPAPAAAPEGRPAPPLLKKGEILTVLVIGVVLVVAVAAVFGQTAAHEFVNYDDPEYVYENMHVRGGLTAQNLTWAFTALAASNWHPLTWLSHQLDCQLFGLHAGRHHLTNVALHAASAVMLFFVLRRMTKQLWPSALVALIFAVHPLRVESVAWVAERKDVLSGLFFMLTLWFYARYVERPESWRRYCLVIVSFALGLMAKPMLVTLPCVLLLLDYWPLGRLDPNRRANFARLLIEKIPLFALAAASCAITFVAQHDAISPLKQLPLPGRLANAATAYVTYVGKLFYPANLAVLYPIPHDSPPDWQPIAAIVLLSGISAFVYRARRQWPYLLFGWLWFIGMLVPVIGLVQVGNQALADRYTYLSQIGLVIAIVWGAVDLSRRWQPRWLLAPVGVAIAVLLAVSGYRQAGYWHDSERLWNRALDCTAENPIAHSNLGNVLARRGDKTEAIGHYRKALERNPNYTDAHIGLSAALIDMGQFDEAIGHCNQGLANDPKSKEALYNLGAGLSGRGQNAEAIAPYRQAIAIDPSDERVHFKLANSLLACEQFDEAIAEYETALRIKPDYADALYNLGNALIDRDLSAAIAKYRQALEIKTDFPDARHNLAVALERRGDQAEAMKQYRLAVEMHPNSPGAHNSLAITLLQCGETGPAAEHFRRALELAEAQNDKPFAAAIRDRLEKLLMSKNFPK